MLSGGNSGAYGFRLVPAEKRCDLPDLVELAQDAPGVIVSWAFGSSLVDADHAGPDLVVTAARGGGCLRVERAPARIDLLYPEPVSAEAMVHPMATMPLSYLASWRGHATLHGGAFHHAGRAWAVCGEQAAGKSSTLALLARRGVPIMADDLLVVDGDQVLAGPNCVDLRPEAAARMPEARSLGMISGRHRYRLATPPSPAVATLGGIFVLEWSDEPDPEASPLTMPDRVELLHRHHYAGRLGPPAWQQVFAMLDVPMWRFRRSRDWSMAERAVDALLELATGA